MTSFTVYTQAIDCEDYFKNFDSDESTELVHVFESQPTPVGGLESFYKSVKEHSDISVVKGKVFVQFVIDTTGQVHCAKVLKTDYEVLNDQAIALIEETKFIPAEQRGKKVVSTMVLPITFGLEPPKEKKQKDIRKSKN
ncbi:MAG: TonB family protein [Cyclobacteriaceae bacterium]|nr:TonB family protein [Cyclobacteriaceae bacterium]